ncbi:MAG TPA: methyltransferase domain-containing protein, partial [Chitinophagaceae bacterium]|nr:methyltransferase domain-containing protein [Chitinophagaceae bacterium]
MIDLHQRSHTEELMDGDDIPFEAVAQTLKELNIVNTRLGGHAITISGVRRLISDATPVSICEIGCGGGDNLFALHKFCIQENIEAVFTGIDINPECIAYAQQQYAMLPCQWICNDYAAVHFRDKQPDIIFSSLFCHHFTNEELVTMLKWMDQNSRKGFFINDLHRHWLAYYLIKYITKIFSRSYLVKNDAALSVARSFTKRDWHHLFQLAGI